MYQKLYNLTFNFDYIHFSKNRYNIVIFGGIDSFSRKVFKYILLHNFLKMSGSLHVTLSSYPDSNRLRGGSALKSAAPLRCTVRLCSVIRPEYAPPPDRALSVSGLITDTAGFSIRMRKKKKKCMVLKSQKSSSEWRSCSRPG